MKKEIKGTTADGKEITVFVKKPGPNQLKMAQLESNRTFAESIKKGCLLKAKTEQTLREQGLWGDEQKNKLKDLSRRIEENELKLKKGGIKLWGEARAIALQMLDDRYEQMQLLSVLNSLDKFTAEGQATDARFDYLCSACILDEYGEPIFKSLEDYQTRANEDIAIKAATELSSQLFGHDPEWESKLSENEFLKSHNMVDDNFRLINKDKHFVDRDGRKINEDGYRVDENDNPIDLAGNKLDKEGHIIVESVPFIED